MYFRQNRVQIKIVGVVVDRYIICQHRINQYAVKLISIATSSNASEKKGARRTTPMQSTLKPPVPLIAINYERKQH